MGERDPSVWAVGIGALVSGAVSAATLALDGQGRIGGALTGAQPTIYGPGQAALAVVLAVGGLLVLIVRRPVALGALLGVIGLCAAQLAGTGLVGRRRWPLFWGCCTDEAVTEGELVRMLATVMAVACGVTAVACLIVLVRRRQVRWIGFDLPVVVAFPAALVVAIAGPRLVAGGWGDASDLAAWALMYSLPFAAGLALSALMQRFAALAMAGAVGGSALVATVGDSFLELNQPWGDAQALVVLAAVIVAASRLIPQGKRALGEATTSSH